MSFNYGTNHVDGPGQRARWIASGNIVPMQSRKTLRMDRRGELAAARHVADYLRDPGAFQFAPFRTEPFLP